MSIVVEEYDFPVHRLRYLLRRGIPVWQGEDSMFFIKKKRIMVRPWKFQKGICKPILYKGDISLINNVAEDKNISMVTVRTIDEDKVLTVWFKKSVLSNNINPKISGLLYENIPQNSPFKNFCLVFAHP